MSGIDQTWLAQIVGHLQHGEPRLALELSLSGLSSRPDDPVLTGFVGIAQAQLGIDDARQSLNKALALGQRTPVVFYHLGTVYEAERDFRSAISACDSAIALDASYYPAKLLKGNCLAHLNQYAEAQRLLERLLHETGDKRIHKNLGVIALENNELANAKYHFEVAVAAYPDWSDAKLNLSFTLLKQGLFDEGWALYEARFDAETERQTVPIELPRWDCKPGRRVLVWTEQGVGDAMMFFSQLPQLIDTCESVGVIADLRLHSLLQRSWPNQLQCFAHDQLDTQKLTASYDYQISIESCAGWFRRHQSQFESVAGPYIQPDYSRVTEFVQQFEHEGKGRKKVGVSWFTANDRAASPRSVAFSELLGALADHESIHFVNLQYGDVSTELKFALQKGIHISHPGTTNFLEDLDSYAAAIAACDHIVSIDNSVVHFAGALGISQSVLLPYTCDWRWGTDQQASMWYADCQLYRQKRRGDWSDPLDEVSDALGRFAQ